MAHPRARLARLLTAAASAAGVGTVVLLSLPTRVRSLDRLTVLLLGFALTAALAAPIAKLRSPDRRDAAVALVLGVAAAVVLMLAGVIWTVSIRPLLQSVADHGGD